MTTPSAEVLDQARRRYQRVRTWTLLGLAAVAVLAGAAIALAVTPWAGTLTAVVLLGGVVLAWALPGRSRGPQYPTERHAAFAALDPDQVRALVTSHGELAAVRDVRRQVPWATLGEVTAYVRNPPRDAGTGRGTPGPGGPGAV